MTNQAPVGYLGQWRLLQATTLPQPSVLTKATLTELWFTPSLSNLTPESSFPALQLISRNTMRPKQLPSRSSSPTVRSKTGRLRYATAFLARHQSRPLLVAGCSKAADNLLT